MTRDEFIAAITKMGYFKSPYQFGGAFEEWCNPGVEGDTAIIDIGLKEFIIQDSGFRSYYAYVQTIDEIGNVSMNYGMECSIRVD